MSAIKIYQKRITPEEAAKFLERNVENRKLTNNHILNLANQMTKGQWMLTGDPIKFGHDGRLLDGQHRLHAIIKHGKPVDMFVADGIEDESFTVIDTGRSRTASDVLSSTGYKNASIISSAVKAILLYQKGIYSSEGGRRDKVTNSDVFNFIEKHPELIEITQFVMGLHRHFKYINVGALTMLYWTLSKKNQQQADSFFGKYASGIELSETSPIRLLRDRLIRDGQNKTKLSTRDKVALFLYAWNAYISKRRVTQLTLQKNYNFPKPI